MGRGRDRRRRKRRRRLAHGRHDEAALRRRTNIDAVLIAAERVTALARFRSLRGQGGVGISFVTYGASVRARNPAELQERTPAAVTERLDANSMKRS